MTTVWGFLDGCRKSTITEKKEIIIIIINYNYSLLALHPPPKRIKQPKQLHSHTPTHHFPTPNFFPSKYGRKW